MSTKPGPTLIPRPAVDQMAGPPAHPGEVLREDFLAPLGIAQTAFAARLGISLQRLNDLLCGRRGVTVDTALRLTRVLGTSAQFRINLQDARELWDAVHGPNAKEIEKLEPFQHDRDGRLVISA